MTDEIHPANALACVRAARQLGLDVAGVDLVCRDIARPLNEQGGAIVEVNAAPGIRMHEHPSLGKRRHVGRAIVDSLFAAGDDGRIPIIAVTGGAGKTAAALSIARALQRIGCVTGVATSDGITVGDRRIKTGDCTGYASARTLLAAPEVEVAVLETARRGMLAHGLGFDRCDVGIVLDALRAPAGQDGHETIADLAKVKGLVVAVARRAVVLNADDATCVQLAARAPRRTEVIYFGFDAAHPAMASHLALGRRAVYMDTGRLIWADGDRHVKLLLPNGLQAPLPAHGRNDVACAMASAAALLALAVPADRVAAVLAGLGQNTPHAMPGSA